MLQSESWLHPLGAHPTEVEQMMGEIVLRVMVWAAQAELESIKRRIAAGVRRAEEEGRFPGRPKALTPDQTAAIRLLRRSGQSQSAVARTFGVSRQTIWRAEQTDGSRGASAQPWPASSAAASRTGVVPPGAGIGRQAIKSRTGGGPGP